MAQVSYLAANTSGLWGEGLRAAVEGYRRGDRFVERPYRPGICPTRPHTGVMMERGFFPEDVERALVLQGIHAVQLVKGKAIAGPADRSKTKNFTIRGTKLAEDIPTLLAYARDDHARRYEGADHPRARGGAAPGAPPGPDGDAPPVTPPIARQTATATQPRPKRRKLLKRVLRRISGQA